MAGRGRLLKCYSCYGSGYKDEMINIPYGSTSQYYHKGECVEKRLKHKAFLEKDNAERDVLNKVLKEIHDVEIVSHIFWRDSIMPLRNGEELKYAKKIKKYKIGFTFLEIAEAYEYCKDTIIRAINKKNSSKVPFDGKLNEYRYGFIIMLDKILLVKKRKEKAEQRKEVAEARSNAQERQMEEYEEREYVYKKPKRNIDISDLL